jgi:hypothetical protein
LAITIQTAKMLWGRSAGRCSMAQCRRTLVIDRTETDDETLVGEMCHMVAEASDGPRGNSPLSREQRDKYDNLILLCRNHHAEIDGQPETFPVDRLKDIKAEHERWVRQTLPEEFDQVAQRDDEIYASYVDEWSQRCNLNGWTNWSGFVLYGGQPELQIEMDKNLGELRHWLLVRIWPRRYPKLEAAFHNFRKVLQDFHEVFHRHLERKQKDDYVLRTEKFYKTRDWDQDRYDKLLSRYEHHVDLVQDLLLELTRGANLICDEVRANLLPSFRIEQGRLAVTSGPHFDLKIHTNIVEYDHAERALETPYPGLEIFETVRATRDMHFGKGAPPQ